MAINPPTDIVLEVVRAADPASRRQATERLAKLADTAAPPATSFEQEVEAAAPLPGPQLPFDASGALVSMRNRHALEARPAGPYERFEAFVLQSFVQTMLPQGAALFGEGTAGEIWRSMLAEGLGTQMARGGGIGIADYLAQAELASGGQQRQDAAARGGSDASRS